MTRNPCRETNEKFIDIEKLFVKNKEEEINNLLICLICRNILLDPEECSQCQRGYCSTCLNKMNPIKCPTCKNPNFGPAHIQTKFNLNQLKFKFASCDCMIPYADYFTHDINCMKNKVKCPNKNCIEFFNKEDVEVHKRVCTMKSVTCPFCDKEKTLKDLDGHMKFECEIKNEKCICGEVIIAKDFIKHLQQCENKLLLDSVSTANTHNNTQDTHAVLQIDQRSEINRSINQEVVQNLNSCRSCEKTNLPLFNCFECNLSHCYNCEEQDRFNVNSYKDFIKEVLHLHILTAINNDINSQSDCEKTSIYLLYGIFGFLIDLALLLFLCTLFLIIFGALQFGIFIPVYYLVWITCLKKRRRCKECASEIYDI
jgi:hypothetical protein